jgi:hypothetical protein
MLKDSLEASKQTRDGTDVRKAKVRVPLEEVSTRSQRRAGRCRGLYCLPGGHTQPVSWSNVNRTRIRSEQFNPSPALIVVATIPAQYKTSLWEPLS